MEISLSKYDILSNIDTTTYNWKCRVRTQCIWKGINKETQQCWGINILFLDDSNNRIHAFMSSKNAEKFGHSITKGHIYVKQYVGHETYRAIRVDKHIYFTEHTRCIKDTSPGLTIEPYAFDLFALEEIQNNAEDNRFLIDVVGIVRNFRPIVSTIKNNVETKRLMFEITDGSSTVKVTLFNEFGEAYEKHLHNSDTEQTVIIIAAAKIHKYERTVNLTNFPATRIYVNPPHESVEDLLQYYEERIMLDISSEDEEESKEILSVDDIKALQTDFIENRMDEKKSWYNARCAKCNIEVFREQGRFKVFTYCSDKTGCIGIVFPDSKVRKIIKKAVFDIQPEYLEEPLVEPFLEELKQLQHKEYKVMLKLTEENIKDGRVPFKAFNLLLIDEQENKMHAFIPGNCADQHEYKLCVGKLYIIANFTVQPYKQEDKFRPVLNDNQIILSNETKIRDIEDKGIPFPNDVFDFYDHNELEKPQNNNMYLVDIVGIIQNRESITLRDLVNRSGENQSQSKFTITDGSSNVNVTFWDTLATKFYKALIKEEEETVIIILTSCKVGSWNDELDISDVGATMFYLNYNHRSVKEGDKANG
ncbi:hypothetical protein POM88_049764 [Heracleum sosnowskyi]|uniref:Replication protein A OB domain-containing protein n=1 Tax=Heracleum sosnowskyi TaxID=360622 RepID=A0AAD8M1Z7_9APIA|nr:hypothetical protein POM88_049764 [Heracleum sosnowskyi]